MSHWLYEKTHFYILSQVFNPWFKDLGSGIKLERMELFFK